MRYFVLVAVAAAICIPRPASAFEVFLDTNFNAQDGRSSQLFDYGSWAQTAAKVNGIWFVAQGLSKPPAGMDDNSARTGFVRHFANRKFAIELYESFAPGKGPAYEITMMKTAGIRDWTAMVYREDRTDSTLDPPDVAATQEAFGRFGATGHPIIVNIRAFGRNKVLPGLLQQNLVDGFSIEWASFYKDSFLNSDVAPAIRAAVQQKKMIFLLVNADHSAAYLGDIQRIYAFLATNCRAQMRSDYVKFVIANYNADSKTQFTPEKTKDGDYENTSTGAALWLIDAADKARLRSSVQAKLVGTWKASLRGGKETDLITFAEDGTFHSEMTGPVEKSLSGTWQIDGARLTEKYQDARQPTASARMMRITIGNVTDDELIFHLPTGDTEKLERISEAGTGSAAETTQPAIPAN